LRTRHARGPPEHIGGKLAETHQLARPAREDDSIPRMSGHIAAIEPLAHQSKQAVGALLEQVAQVCFGGLL
jgi:hypothetical protein